MKDRSDDEDDDEKRDKNKEFIALIKEIKNEEDDVEIEGGSDSEGSEEDLTKEETSNLVSQILKRNNCQQYKNHKLRKIKNPKITYRKDDAENKKVIPEEADTKKYSSSRLLDLSKPPQQKLMRRGISYEYEKVVLVQKNFTMLI